MFYCKSDLLGWMLFYYLLKSKWAFLLRGSKILSNLDFASNLYSSPSQFVVMEIPRVCRL